MPGSWKKRSDEPPLSQVPRWKARRLWVLKRDKHLCQLCKRKQATEVDHIRPRSQGGDHEYDNLMAVCSDCHEVKTLKEAQPHMRERIAFDQDGNPIDSGW